MKFLIILLAILPFAVNAASPSPAPRKVPKMTWAVRPMVHAEMLFSTEDTKQIYKTGVDAVNAVTDRAKLAQMIQTVGETIVHFSNISEEQAALEMIDAAFALMDLQKKADEESTMSGAAAVSFVAFPSSVEALKRPLPLRNFREFRDRVFEGMSLAQDAYLQSPANDRKWYFLGALGNARVSSKGENDVHLQLVLGLKGQTIVQGENTIVIPDSRVGSEMPVAIVDISMPITFTFPQIEISFGTLGQLQPTRDERIRDGRRYREDSEWRFKFAPNPGVGCSRAWATPRVLSSFKNVPLSIPVYSVTVDGNEQLVSAAKAGFGGINAKIHHISFANIGCGFDVMNTVGSKFMAQVNQNITDSTFRDLLGLSLRELADRVKRLKEQDEAKQSQD